MTVLTSPQRTRPRFGPQAGLVAATRGVARLTRQLAGDWCGVPVPERYAPPPAGRLTYTGRLRWLVTDPATWRDLLWIAANLVVCVPAALSAALIATGLIEFIG